MSVHLSQKGMPVWIKNSMPNSPVLRAPALVAAVQAPLALLYEVLRTFSVTVLRYTLLRPRWPIIIYWLISKTIVGQIDPCA